MSEDPISAADARAVANYMLDHKGHSSVPLTNLSVQKLVFFAHGISISVTGQPLVRNSFEAWNHGPVVPALYEAFKSSRSSPLSKRALWYDWDNDRHIPVPAELDPRSATIVDVVLAVYGHLDGFALSDLTHEPGTPWYAVRFPPPGILYLNNRIPDNLIGRFFKTTTKTIHRFAIEKVHKHLE